MKPVLTPEEMAAADRRAIAAGATEAVLVERAGRAVAHEALSVLSGRYGRRAVVVCGKGNNGADGRVAARILRMRGVGVDEFALADALDGAVLQRAVARADIAIDAMFGTGFRGRLEGDAAQVAGVFEAARATVLAVDIPSGVDGATGAVRGPAVAADATVSFAALKPGLLFEPGRTLAGRVEVVDIGIDAGAPDLHVLDERDLALPVRVAGAHKWSSGLLVIGGSTGMTGAPVMSSRAAARSGAGMVVCALPGREAAARASADEIVTRALPATEGGALAEDAARAVLDGIGRFRAAAIGPGLGRDARTQAAIGRIIAEAPVPIVVDADALNALAEDSAPLRVRHAAGLPLAVLTPHAGEYERLAGEPVGEDRLAAARKLAARTNAVVLLKGPGTVIAHPHGDAVINRTDSPALATAGTGDVLTGIIAGLIADGAAPYLAAASGAYLHGLAARVADTAPDLVASDLIAALHPTLELLRSRSGTAEV